MIIEAGQTWSDQETGEQVVVIWVSDELVTYQTQGKAIQPMRKFVFLQQFEECSGE